MEYGTNMIENGEATYIVTEKSVIEYKKGAILITVDGRPEQIYIFESSVKRLFNAMKEYFDGRTDEAENS